MLSALRRQQALTPDESLANVLNRLEEAVDGNLDVKTKEEVLRHLDAADPANLLLQSIKGFVLDVDPSEHSGIPFYFQARDWFLRSYRRFLQHRWFDRAFIAIFAAAAVGQVTVVVAFFFGQDVFGGADGWSFVAVASFTSSTGAGILIIIGLWRLRYSHLDSYHWFTRAILVNIFITQVFVFLDSQLAGIGGLVLDLLFYIALQFLIELEETPSLVRKPPN